MIWPSLVPRPQPAHTSLPVYRAKLKAIQAGVGFGSGTKTRFSLHFLSLVPRSLPWKAERGSGVLSDFSCHMGWSLWHEECHITFYIGTRVFWQLKTAARYGSQRLDKATKFLGKAENKLWGKLFFTSNSVQNTITYVMHIIMRSRIWFELSDRGATLHNVTRKVVQNTRPSFSHVRRGAGHETITLYGLVGSMNLCKLWRENWKEGKRGSFPPVLIVQPFLHNCKTKSGSGLGMN